MFGMRHSGSREERHGVGRHGHWGRHHRHGGGRQGREGGFGGGGDMKRFGRMLAQGDLRLLALALIAEQPRHGYEIIKVLEDKTEGWYAPSPGIVYPTLTYLEEAGYVTAQADGTKKLYTITDEGRATSRRTARSSMRCWSGSRPSASAPAGCAIGSARTPWTIAATPRCRARSRARSRISAKWCARRSPAIPAPKRR